MKKNKEAFMKMIASKKETKSKDRVSPSNKLTDKFLKGQKGK